jgi:ACR3 family arsenite transporter
MSTNSVSAKLPVFERYLSVWVILCIICGILFGKVFPQAVEFLNRIEVAKVNIPVAILIWLMIYPMMVQIDFSSIVRVGKKPKGLAITLVVNWVIKPFTMAVFAVIFLKYLFSAFINPILAKEYIAGAILLGAAPCTAMVFVWSYLTKGNPAHTLVQVAVNDLVILIAFVPIVKFLLGVNQITVPYDTLIYSTILFVVVPLAGGYISRQQLIKHKGAAWFENIFLKILKPVTILGLLLTLILLFAFQGKIIIKNPLHILLIAIPLTLQTYFIFAVGYFWARKWRVEHSIASPAALIGASNFFELAVAVAISLFGLKSGAALATVVGVLTEVPIMLSLVNFSNKTRHWFAREEKIHPEVIMTKGRKLLWQNSLIATDLSETSNEVVECVAKEGKDFTKKARLVHVISVETAGGIEDVLEKAHKPVIEKQLEMLKSAGIDASYTIAYGIPSVEINRLIAEENYQLLVLGSHSKSLGKEMLLGSVSDSIIRNLTIPALLIKCKGEKHAVCPLVFSGNILFPTDFSENAKAAFDMLTSLVNNYNPAVTLYHIQDKNIVFPHLSHKLEEFNRIDTERLNTLKESLLSAGAKNVITKLGTGHTKQLIINEINSNDYRLVVMGTQGRGWIEEVFIGGVAHAVIRKSNTSLLLVPFRK